eukprot:3861133-Lingulodinium_polyedra.AAC.1
MLQMQGLEIIDWVALQDILVIGVGHDPAVVAVSMTRLRALAENIKVFHRQPLIPIVQPKRKTGFSLCSYVEYLLIGCGPEYNRPSVPAFLQ